VERDIANWEDLDQCLERAERLLKQPPGLPVRLIVIDSIAHIYRDVADFGTGAHPLHIVSPPIKISNWRFPKEEVKCDKNARHPFPEALSEGLFIRACFHVLAS
jgi:hypothetical protein